MNSRIFDESIELKDSAMLKRKPQLFGEWDFEKNDRLGLDIYKMTYGSDKKVWWIGECGHGWDATIASRTSRSAGCSYCSNKKILIGFNDMWTTNPELASMLLNPEDGYKYMQSMAKKVDWKCLECGEIVENKLISNINNRGLSCLICSDGVSFPERFLYNLLKESGIKFRFEMKFKWSKEKRYDFYLYKHNSIVEVHGGQHYFGGFERAKGRSLIEEQENDRLKERLARENGFDNYIIIDARYSTVEWIKKSILNSELMDIVNDIDFEKIGQLASKSFVKIACDLWVSGIRSVAKITKIMKLDRSTIVKYLKRGTEIGWCDYSAEVEIENRAKSSRKQIIQLSSRQEFIREWQSIKDAAESINVHVGSITRALIGSRKSLSGFHWMYKDEYELLKDKIQSGEFSLPQLKNKSVVQLDSSSTLIQIWDSITEASASLDISRGHISSVCRGKRKTSGGFKWMYLEDYNKMARSS